LYEKEFILRGNKTSLKIQLKRSNSNKKGSILVVKTIPVQLDTNASDMEEEFPLLLNQYKKKLEEYDKEPVIENHSKYHEIKFQTSTIKEIFPAIVYMAKNLKHAKTFFREIEKKQIVSYFGKDLIASTVITPNGNVVNIISPLISNSPLKGILLSLHQCNVRYAILFNHKMIGNVLTHGRNIAHFVSYVLSPLYTVFFLQIHAGDFLSMDLMSQILAIVNLVGMPLIIWKYVSPRIIPKIIRMGLKRILQ